MTSAIEPDFLFPKPEWGTADQLVTRYRGTPMLFDMFDDQVVALKVSLGISME